MGTEAKHPSNTSANGSSQNKFPDCCWNHCITTALNISLALQHFFEEAERMEVTRWYIRAVRGMVQHLQVHGVLPERVDPMVTGALCNMITVIVSMPGHFLSVRYKGLSGFVHSTAVF
jgi:hypothetical protein